jgi:hypothetical protein
MRGDIADKGVSMPSALRSFLVTTFLSFFFISLAHADWNNASLQWAQRFSSGPVLFPSSYLVEAWSTVQAQPVRDAHLWIESVPSSKFGSGKFTVALQIKRTKSLAPLRAPLILFLPGLYSSKDDHGSMRMAAYFSAIGYHVVIPSNPWSEDFLKENPHFNPGDLDKEAEVALEALDYAIKRIGAENISKISVAGESYGALGAAVAFEKDQARAHPLIDGTVTLFSPPLRMQQAIDNLDQGTDNTQSTWDTECSSIKNLITDYNSLSYDSSEASMNPELVRCAAPLIYHSFQDGLVESIETLNKIKNLGLIPTDKSAFTQWKRDLRFESAIQIFTPETVAILSKGEGHLRYWIDLLPAEAFARLQIISTQDDLLNQGLSWNIDNGGPFTSKNVILLPWGGHIGYESLPLFQQLVDAAF